MAYADYEFYTATFVGQLDSETFVKYSEKASNYIDAYTLDKSYKYYNSDNRNARVDRALALACCEATDVMAKAAQAIEKAEQVSVAAGSGVYTSETVGAHSVSYRSGSELSKDLRTQLNGILGVYLAGTGLLYRGIPVCIPRML